MTMERELKKEDILKLREIVGHNSRDALLFEMAISLGLRTSKLLKLRAKDMRGDYIVDPDTLKYISVNELTKAAFVRYKREVNLEENQYIFHSKDGFRPLSISTVSNIIRGWVQQAAIEGGYTGRDLCKYGNTQQVKRKEDEALVIHSSLQQQIYDVLYRQIVCGTIPPGTEMVSTQLAKQFNVSLTPIRYALASLEAQGFVETSPGKSCIVKSITYEMVAEISELRKILEPFALVQAWPNINNDTIELLENIFEAYMSSQEWENFITLHRDFHMAIYRPAHMNLLVEFIESLHNKTSALLYSYYIDLSNEENSNAKFKDSIRHKTLLNALKNRDKVLALEMIQQDITNGEKILKEYFHKQR